MRFSPFGSAMAVDERSEPRFSKFHKNGKEMANNLLFLNFGADAIFVSLHSIDLCIVVDLS